MTARRKTPEEKIAELEQQEKTIKARLQREKAKLRQAERKADTRRKIIAGARLPWNMPRSIPPSGRSCGR